MKNNWDNVLLMLLSPAEAVLLMVLMERAGDGDKERPIVVSYPQLSKLSSVAITSIRKHIQMLECLGFLKIDVDSRTNGNAYIIRWKKITKVSEALKKIGDIDKRVTYCSTYRNNSTSKKEVTR